MMNANEIAETWKEIVKIYNFAAHIIRRNAT